MATPTITQDENAGLGTGSERSSAGTYSDEGMRGREEGQEGRGTRAEAQEKARQYVQKARTRLEEVVRDRPMMALGAAFILGITLRGFIRRA